MLVCKELTELRTQIKQWRSNNEQIAFVPTMGNLHQGHLSLVEIAKNGSSQNASTQNTSNSTSTRVVVSIYVNPLQFSPDEDFSSYPRTLENDLQALKDSAVDLVFIPDSNLIYAKGELQSCYAEVPELSHIIEGKIRPGFFRGVATVVLKLFNMVQPDVAVFGEKDYQQLLIIKQMVSDLQLPVEVISGETKREADGLAMSSRNNYLSTEERENSRVLSETLAKCRHQIEQGMAVEQSEKDCEKALSAAGFDVDYVTLRDTTALKKLAADMAESQEVILLAAARLGKTRLIDNLKFEYKPV